MVIQNIYQDGFTAYKLVIKFSELTNRSGESLGLSDYTVVSRPDIENSEKWLASQQFDFICGNDDVETIGMAESSTALMDVFDWNGTLNPDNDNSPYYGYLINGVHAIFYKSSGIVPGSEPGDENRYYWSAYGDWYTTAFNAELSDGSFAPVHISFEDRLNTIGAKHIEFEAEEAAGYSGLTADALLAAVFTNAGLTSDDYYISIDSSITYYTGFTAKNGELVRDVVNRICQLTCSRCYVRPDLRRVIVEPVLSCIYGNSVQLEGMTALTSSLRAAAMYDSVKVTYYKKASKIPVRVGATSADLVTGSNVVNIDFDEPVVGIDNIRVYSQQADEDEEATSNSVSVNLQSWFGWEGGVTVNVGAYGGDVSDVNFEVIGRVATDKKSKTVNINNNVKTESSLTYEYDSGLIMSKADATATANRLAGIIKSLSVVKAINDTYYTMSILPGDCVVVVNATPSFDGTYKVNRTSIVNGEGYNMTIELIKIA